MEQTAQDHPVWSDPSLAWKAQVMSLGSDTGDQCNAGGREVI